MLGPNAQVVISRGGVNPDTRDITDDCSQAANSSHRKLLSIIMPARNEEANLPRAYDEVTALMAVMPYDHEVILIDNDSTDGTGLIAEEICVADPRWRYLKFSRNFELETSISAGLQYARGDAAIVLFSDLQDPPELIADFVKKWEGGYDVVYGVLRKRTGDSFLRATMARMYYWLIHRLSDVEITPNATDFRLLSRRAIEAMNQFRERNRFVRGLAHWIGFKRCAIEYDRRPRVAGQSKAPFWYCLNLAINAITCFSIRPLQMFSLAGVAATIGTLIFAGVHLTYFMLNMAIPGMTTVYMLLMANLAVMLLGFGTLGEYIGRIYIEAKQRPLFLIERTINLEIELSEKAGTSTADCARNTAARERQPQEASL